MGGTGATGGTGGASGKGGAGGSGESGAAGSGESGAAGAGGTAGQANGGAGGSAGSGGSVVQPPGAHLPIDYDLGSLAGLIRFVATDGADTNAGTEVAPLRTLGAAIASIGSGATATIVVRGGTYAEGKLQIPGTSQIRILAYPGEVPVFNGARLLDGPWTSEGGLAWHAYTAQPVTDGAGISFTTGQNLTGAGVGKHPDQVWIGSTKLQQVPTKAEVTAGKFWVDAMASRVYLTVADAAMPGVEASQLDQFIRIRGAGSVLEGLRITRFSNSADDYGVVLVEATAGGSALRQVEIIDAAFQAVVHAGRADDILVGAILEHVTIEGPNWMGVNSTYVDNLVLDRVRIVGADPFDEFTSSPQSGGLKTSRCRGVRVLGSDILDNKSHGLWFDQSNVDVDVVGNRLTGNTGSAIFFEISDDLLMINNYVRAVPGAPSAVKLAGSSGLKLVNNTVVGGADPIGIYTDSRSKPGCAAPGEPLCTGSYSSDRDMARPLPTTLDWMPRLDLMLNNIVAHPAAGYCGTAVALCITSTNAGAYQPVEKIVHHADPARGIPQTIMDGNVYADDAGSIIGTELGGYTSAAAWCSAAATAPISLAGIDAQSKSGTAYVDADGAATSALDHDEAIPIPVDAEINAYLAAGTRHYGVLD
jgi:hypothetical protein